MIIENPDYKNAQVSVDVKNVSKRFTQQEVLKDVSFTVNPGEIFVIMGPSGSGKSVLLRSIIGLTAPNEGTVSINSSNAIRSKDVVTSFVFQAGALFNSLTVYDNLAFYSREHRLFSKKKLDAKVMNTLKMLSLQDAADKFPSQLSGGMRKRVAIARSLMMDPQLLLYDEPTSELDPTMAANICELIGVLSKEMGVTSVVVSHDRDLASSISHRVAILLDGRIKAIDTMANLYKSDDILIKEFLNPKVDLENPRFKN